jgi:DNA-binding MarR family transcriptional regulator
MRDSVAGVRLAEAFGAELEAHGVTLPMWRVMAALPHRSEQRVGELAEMASIEVSTLSQLLGTMERKNLVERRRSAADARTVQVRLTDIGAGITHLIIPRALHYEEVALESFSPAEAEALWAMLVRLFRNVDSLDAEALARIRRSARGAQFTQFLTGKRFSRRPGSCSILAPRGQ